MLWTIVDTITSICMINTGYQFWAQISRIFAFLADSQITIFFRGQIQIVYFREAEGSGEVQVSVHGYIHLKGGITERKGRSYCGGRG